VLAEAARVLRPGGALVVVDLAEHGHTDMIERLAHRWPGFSEAAMHDFLTGARLEPGAATIIPGPFEVRLWSAHRPAEISALTSAFEAAR
jgi:ArsR family transcriptional regulator